MRWAAVDGIVAWSCRGSGACVDAVKRRLERMVYVSAREGRPRTATAEGDGGGRRPRAGTKNYRLAGKKRIPPCWLDVTAATVAQAPSGALERAAAMSRLFDGSFRSRPTVSLRGQSKREESKEDLVLKAQQARRAGLKHWRPTTDG